VVLALIGFGMQFALLPNRPSSSMQAMRQDCTVQHLRRELTVRIYEAHARAALEYGDVAEYNQCQTQLNALAIEVRQGFSPPSYNEHPVALQRAQAMPTRLPGFCGFLKCEACNDNKLLFHQPRRWS